MTDEQLQTAKQLELRIAKLNVLLSQLKGEASRQSDNLKGIALLDGHGYHINTDILDSSFKKMVEEVSIVLIIHKVEVEIEIATNQLKLL